MNWKLAAISSLLGTLLSLIPSALIFFGFPRLSNHNVEDYILAGILFSAGLSAFLTFRRAASRKTLHALVVFAAVCISTVLVFVLLLLILFIVCRITPCRLFPFS